MIFAAGGTLAFFYVILLLCKKPKMLSDKILTSWMFLLGVHLYLYYFHIKDFEYTYPHLLGIGIPLPLVHGPLLFLYTGALISYFPKWKNIFYLHFLPLVIFYLHYFTFFISTGQQKLEFFKQMAVKPDTFFLFVYPSLILSGFSYILLTFLLFRKHRRNILNNLSNSNDKNNLHWLRNLLIGLLIIWLVIFFSNLLVGYPLADTAIYLSTTIFVAFIGIFGLRQGNIFMNLPNGTLPPESMSEDQPRYSKSGLKEERAAEIKHSLIKLMEDKKLFLDENISLPQLAEMLNIHPNYLSQVINEKFQKNFYDFINSYRVEEFKRLIASGRDKNKTFFALALDCGFNSKASFNNSFKRITSITPSEFAKSL
jgi:AraC-like DNA-binding protein